MEHGVLSVNALSPNRANPEISMKIHATTRINMENNSYVSPLQHKKWNSLGADRMANNVDLDQTAPEGAV